MGCRNIGLRTGSIRRTCKTAGFSAIELVITVSILMILVTMCIPLVNSVFQTYRFRGAVSYATGAIQTTRYRALQNGCLFQANFTAAGSTFQVQSACDPANPGVFSPLAASDPLGGVLPISGSGTVVTLSANTSFIFHPGGRVDSPQAGATGNTTFTISQGGKQAIITVSRYGNIKTTFQ